MQRRWAYWLVPDLGLLLSIVTLLICLFLFDGTRELFRDSDSGWHIRTGEMILRSGALPYTDPYSLTRAGQPWFAWEWGSDVVMAAAHRAGGLGGVAFLYAAVLAACTWMWLRLHFAAGGSFLIAGAMATLLLSTGNLHWLARPHIFSWLFLLGCIRPFTPPKLWVAAVLSILWTNLHASFFLGPLIFLLYAAGHFLQPLLWQTERTPAAKQFLLAALVALAASLVNPYGWKLHAHVFHYLRDHELLSRVGEYQSFNFHSQGAAQILITLAVAAIGGVLAIGQRDLPHLFLTMLFLAMALRSARALPLVALLLLPLANGAVTRALNQAQGLQPRVRNALNSFLEYSRNLRLIDLRHRGYALIPLLLCLAWVGVPAHAGFPPNRFPVRAASHLPLTARLLAPDMYGGYLIYRFDGALKVFFDGRSDFYGSAFMKDYLRMIEARPGWKALLGSHAFTHALLPNRYSLLPALEQLGWRKLYSDEVATLLEKP